LLGNINRVGAEECVTHIISHCTPSIGTRLFILFSPAVLVEKNLFLKHALDYMITQSMISLYAWPVVCSEYDTYTNAGAEDIIIVERSTQLSSNICKFRTSCVPRTLQHGRTRLLIFVFFRIRQTHTYLHDMLYELRISI